MGNIFIKRSINESLESGNLNLLIETIQKNNLNISDEYLTKSLEYGHISIITYLVNNYKLKIDLKKIEDLLKKNKVEILKNLIESNLINYELNSLFILGSKYNLDFLRYLYAKDDIDINSNNDRAFFNACIFKKVNIARWLYYRGAKYDHCDDQLFKICCQRKNLVIVDFLKSLCERYEYEYCEDSNIIIPIIEDLNYYLIRNKNWEELIVKNKMSVIENFNNEECVISLDESNFLTNCNHYFKIDYLMEWLFKNNTCPLCTLKIDFKKCSVSKKYFINLMNLNNLRKEVSSQDFL